MYGIHVSVVDVYIYIYTGIYMYIWRYIYGTPFHAPSEDHEDHIRLSIRVHRRVGLSLHYGKTVAMNNMHPQHLDLRKHVVAGSQEVTVL